MIQGLWMVFALIPTVLGFDCPLDPAWRRLIDSSLSPFSSGITQQMIDKAKEGTLLCPIAIKDHKVISKCMLKQHDCFMRAIAKHLPDLEFVLNYDDRPRVYKNRCDRGSEFLKCACDQNYQKPPHAIFIQTPGDLFNERLPVFSQSTIFECYLDILFPSYLHFDYNYQIHRSVLWQKKEFKAIWRGTSTGGVCDNWEQCRSFQRQRLVQFCSSIPDCDAGFHRLDQCTEEMCKKMNEIYGIKRGVSFAASKIIIDIDGNSYSGRFPFLLESGSAVFKIFAFDDLITMGVTSGEHYVAVKMDLSDLEEKLDWARANDESLREIAGRGQKRIKQIGNRHSYECYVINLLQKYHSLLRPSPSNLKSGSQP